MSDVTTMRRPHRLVGGVVCFQCRRCEAWRPETLFHRLGNPASRCHRSSWCKECANRRRSDLRRETVSRQREAEALTPA